MYLPLKWWTIALFLVLNITEIVTVSLVQDSPAEANLTQYEESYFPPTQTTPPTPHSPGLPDNTTRAPGASAAASNWGGIVRWENVTQRFVWREKRQTVGRTVFMFRETTEASSKSNRVDIEMSFSQIQS